MTAKPVKLWTAERIVKKAAVVTSLADLLIKGREKLGISSGQTVKVVLEQDGTEIDDEEYFSWLKNDTILIFLQDGEVWCPESSQNRLATMDIPDGIGATDGRSLAELTTILRTDVARIITFSNEEFESIVSASEDLLASLLGNSTVDVRNIQQTCQRYLDDRLKAMEAMQLLKMFKESTTISVNNTLDAQQVKGS